VELAERLKRGEELAPRPPPAGPAHRPAPEQEPGASAPFQVPTDLPRFVGRLPELEAFRAALSAAGPERARPYCLAGMGGIGKTSLAVHIAHSLRDQFPDGVLWAHVSTSEPLAILDSWARAYQCDYSGLPDLESRAAALRALLADKGVLIILDDVWDAARARSLLVGGPAATVLLTGRDMDVAQALDAQIVALPVFAAEESQQLLARIVGQARVMAEASAADQICQLLGHLPLALDPARDGGAHSRAAAAAGRAKDRRPGGARFIRHQLGRAGRETARRLCRVGGVSGTRLSPGRARSRGRAKRARRARGLGRTGDPVAAVA
jgi:hypothetical protein